jgi:ferredoxin--NADP+ reductase
MGAPYTSDLLYHEQLLQLQREFDNFNYVCAISREPHAESQRGIYVDRLFQLQRERLAPLLAAPHTLLYLCGLAGMQFGVFRQLRSLGLLDGYATPAAALCARSVADWSDQAMRHAVKPNERCMLEVY